MIKAAVVADTAHPVFGTRVTTVLVNMPRIILAELNKHRVFANSAASSRAIPFSETRRILETEPFVPLHWGAKQSGMQADHQIPEADREDARAYWLDALADALHHAEQLDQLGVHKQVVNRLLEPWMWSRVVITATDWQNFFRQRCHPKAEPHFQLAATAIRDAMAASSPAGSETHLPFVSPDEQATYSIITCAKLSAARCGRVSYYGMSDEVQTVERSLARFDRFMEGDPPDLVPCEHPCFAASVKGRYRHLRDWRPYRISVERLRGYSTVEGTDPDIPATPVPTFRA